MFPLGTVLVPGAPLPLQIFEPRYRSLLDDVLAGDGTFGVVLIERGTEVGGGDVRFDVGTLARIVEHRELDDGRHALLAVGTERIRVEKWLDDDPYPRAETTPWPDEDDPDAPTTRERYARCTAALRQLLAAATEAGHPVAPATFEAPTEPSAGTHLLSALAPIGPLDRQRLLQAPGTVDRLQLLHDCIDDAFALLSVG